MREPEDLFWDGVEWARDDGIHTPCEITRERDGQIVECIRHAVCTLNGKPCCSYCAKTARRAEGEVPGRFESDLGFAPLRRHDAPELAWEKDPSRRAMHAEKKGWEVIAFEDGGWEIRWSRRPVMSLTGGSAQAVARGFENDQAEAMRRAARVYAALGGP